MNFGAYFIRFSMDGFVFPHIEYVVALTHVSIMTSYSLSILPKPYQNNE